MGYWSNMTIYGEVIYPIEDFCGNLTYQIYVLRDNDGSCEEEQCKIEIGAKNYTSETCHFTYKDAKL